MPRKKRKWLVGMIWIDKMMLNLGKREAKNLKVIQPMCDNSGEFMHARYNGTQLKCCICIFINKIKCIDCRKLQK